MKISEIRKEAREKLQGKWLTAVGIYLLYLVIAFIFSFLSKKYSIFNIIFAIINIPLSFGILISFMKLIDNENVQIFDFIKYSFKNFSKAWNLYFTQALKLLLPIILVFIILISIYALSYRLFISYISNTDTTGLFFSIIVLVILLIPLLIWLYAKSLLYVLIFQIAYYNPELSVKDVIEKSSKLMKNHRWKYLSLSCSFIGWAILSILTLGIGMLWLLPYIIVSTISFYKHLANENNSSDELKSEVEKI